MLASASAGGRPVGNACFRIDLGVHPAAASTNGEIRNADFSHSMVWFMKRQLLIMLVVLSSLLFWERRLARQESQTRHAALRIQRLVSQDLFKDRPIAALQLEAPDGKTFFYAHQKGVWRCLSMYGAVALTPQIQTVLGKVIKASGVVQSQVSEYSTNLTSFGLDSSQRWRLALCGSKVRS